MGSRSFPLNDSLTFEQIDENIQFLEKKRKVAMVSSKSDKIWFNNRYKHYKNDAIGAIIGFILLFGVWNSALTHAVRVGLVFNIFIGGILFVSFFVLIWLFAIFSYRIDKLNEIETIEL